MGLHLLAYPVIQSADLATHALENPQHRTYDEAGVAPIAGHRETLGEGNDLSVVVTCEWAIFW